MADLTCSFCKTPAVANAIYCYQCGHQLKCKSCQEVLVEGANNCISCGAPVGNKTRVVLNSIRFKENKDERSYELEFTNDVGKEIKEVVADLLKDKLGNSVGKTIALQEISEEQISFSETEITSAPQEQSASEPTKREEEKDITKETYPHLDDLEFSLHCRENEWLLIFAFYKSHFGTTFFSKNAVWDIYKQKRKTETRFKNLGTNWKSLFKKYISTVRENEFKFTPAGLDKVRQLLKGQEQEKRVSKVKKRKITNPEILTTHYRTAAPAFTRKVVANSIMQEEFDAYKNSYKESLENFFNRKKPGTSTPNRIVAMGYYITKINGQDYFTEGNIDFAFRLLNLSGKPIHLTQVITNLKNEKVWFQRIKQGDISGWRLTRQAEIYVEEKLPPVS